VSALLPAPSQFKMNARGHDARTTAINHMKAQHGVARHGGRRPATLEGWKRLRWRCTVSWQWQHHTPANRIEASLAVVACGRA
jgi:hypothetical protein